MSKTKTKYLRDMYNWKTSGVKLYCHANSHNINAMMNCKELNMCSRLGFSILDQLDRVKGNILRAFPDITYKSVPIVVSIDFANNYWTVDDNNKAREIIRLFKAIGFGEVKPSDMDGSRHEESIWMKALNY